MIEHQQNHELFCFVVNLHALTSTFDPDRLRNQTYDAICDFLALGLDPDKSVFWVQSDVPEVTELTWFLSNITGMGLLERCHSYKDKLAKGIPASHGLFSYPVLMAADILLYNAERVPVGKDQKQHVEVARDIALRFNSTYGETFVIPEPDIEDELATIPGLDGQKMSKSYGNTIEIFCDEASLKSKIMTLKTDSTPIDQPKPIEGNILFDLYSLFLDEPGQGGTERPVLNPGTEVWRDQERTLSDNLGVLCPLPRETGCHQSGLCN